LNYTVSEFEPFLRHSVDRRHGSKCKNSPTFVAPFLS